MIFFESCFSKTLKPIIPLFRSGGRNNNSGCCTRNPSRRCDLNSSGLAGDIPHWCTRTLSSAKDWYGKLRIPQTLWNGTGHCWLRTQSLGGLDWSLLQNLIGDNQCSLSKGRNTGCWNDSPGRRVWRVSRATEIESTGTFASCPGSSRTSSYGTGGNLIPTRICVRLCDTMSTNSKFRRISNPYDNSHKQLYCAGHPEQIRSMHDRSLRPFAFSRNPLCGRSSPGF